MLNGLDHGLSGLHPVPDMTDWPALITRLERHMRHIDIAAACGRSEGWVGLLKRGTIKEPPYSVGALLILLDVKEYGRTLSGHDALLYQGDVSRPT